MNTAAVTALESIKWKSADRDNMEFTARITYVQMNAINAAIAEADLECLAAAAASIRHRIGDVLLSFHRNSCYPDALGFEVEAAINDILAAIPAEPVAQWHPGVMRALSEKPTQTSDTTPQDSAALREALEPFAKAADPYDGCPDGALWGDDGISIGDVRRARAVLAKGERT